MAKIEKIAIEMMIGCKNLGYDINYFKLQKLLYISNCVHYAMYDVPISPALVFYWTNGGGFKEIYSLFNNRMDLDGYSNIEDDFIEELRKGVFNQYNLVYIEQEVVNFVLAKYGNKELEELVKLTLTDPLYQEISIGNRIDVSKLSNLFITENEQKHISDYYDYLITKKEYLEANKLKRVLKS